MYKTIQEAIDIGKNTNTTSRTEMDMRKNSADVTPPRRMNPEFFIFLLRNPITVELSILVRPGSFNGMPVGGPGLEFSFMRFLLLVILKMNRTKSEGRKTAVPAKTAAMNDATGGQIE